MEVTSAAPAPSADFNVNLDILRDSHHTLEQEWLNRSCQDAETKKTLYYCEAAPDHKLTIHRGDKTGPVIATTGGVNMAKKGVTEVYFPDESNPIILEHVHHEFLHIHGKTMFTYNGKKYHWKGHTGLVDDKTDTLLAIFHSSWFDLNWNKVGRLEITSEGKNMLDMAVITALIVQERSDEGKQARELARKKANEAGVPFF